jgi:hypothetical protein
LTGPGRELGPPRWETRDELLELWRGLSAGLLNVKSGDALVKKYALSSIIMEPVCLTAKDVMINNKFWEELIVYFL